MRQTLQMNVRVCFAPQRRTCRSSRRDWTALRPGGPIQAFSGVCRWKCVRRRAAGWPAINREDSGNVFCAIVSGLVVGDQFRGFQNCRGKKHQSKSNFYKWSSRMGSGNWIDILFEFGGSLKPLEWILCQSSLLVRRAWVVTASHIP